MANGRCRLHGGLSTGPRTAEGLERVRRAVTKHGRYSIAAKAERLYYRNLLKMCETTLGEIDGTGGWLRSWRPGAPEPMQGPSGRGKSVVRWRKGIGHAHYGLCPEKSDRFR